jgi:hypothetical protein
MKESYYSSAVEMIQQLQAVGAPFVLLAVESDFDLDDMTEGDRVNIFMGTNTVFEAIGMIHSAVEQVRSGGE